METNGINCFLAQQESATALHSVLYSLLQEAMESFVFPDEIKTKLMKMNKLMNIFSRPPKILQKCSVLYVFSLRTSENTLFFFDCFLKGNASI